MSDKVRRIELTITLGNDAMQTPIDVADALHQVARDIAGDGFPEQRTGIRDLNGNTVGSYSAEREEA